MEQYQHHDGRKITLDIDEPAVVIRDGSRCKTFSSHLAAILAYESMVEDLTAAGFRLQHRKLPDTEIFRKLVALSDLSSPDLCLNYAHELCTTGHTYGELIEAATLAGNEGSDAETWGARYDELFTKRARELLGPLRFVTSSTLELKWRHGFVQSASLGVDWDDAFPNGREANTMILHLLRHLLTSPVCCLMTSLYISDGDQRTIDCLADIGSQTIKNLSLGHYSSCGALNVRRLPKALPRLVDLTSMAPTTESTLCTHWPRVERLWLDLSSLDEPLRNMPVDFAMLEQAVPRLRSLVLTLKRDIADIAAQLATLKLLSQLESISIRVWEVTSEELQAIAQYQSLRRVPTLEMVQFSLREPELPAILPNLRVRYWKDDGEGT